MKNMMDYIADHYGDSSKKSSEVSGNVAPPSQGELDQIIKKYPFFTSARVILFDDYKKRSNLLKMLQIAGIAPLTKELIIDKDEFKKRSTLEIIDQFLNKEDHKIIPNETTPEGDVSAIYTSLDDDEIISEELAEIMLAQGLKEQAKQMYVKLSLLYPKKSVYFAEIISKIDDNE